MGKERIFSRSKMTAIAAAATTALLLACGAKDGGLEPATTDVESAPSHSTPDGREPASVPREDSTVSPDGRCGEACSLTFMLCNGRCQGALNEARCLCVCKNTFCECARGCGTSCQFELCE